MICFCYSYGCGQQGGLEKSRSIWYTHKRKDTERRQKCEEMNQSIDPILQANTERASAVRVSREDGGSKENSGEEINMMSIGQRSCSMASAEASACG